MGANHQGEIQFLSEIAKPNFGVITNIGKAHLEGFKDFEGVKKTKKELYDYIKKVNGLVFLNSDDDILNEISKDLDLVKYGKSGDYFGSLIDTSVFCEVIYEKTIIKSQLIGDYQFYNIMLAIAIAKHFKVKDNNIFKAIKEYKPKNNRSQIINTNDNLIILDAYNANPSSMNNMILSFNKIKKENKICVLGDMGELGKFSEKEHIDIVKLMQELQIPTFYVGREFCKAIKNDSFQSTEEFKKHLESEPIKNSTVLIKGSRSQKIGGVIRFTLIYFKLSTTIFLKIK